MLRAAAANAATKTTPAAARQIAPRFARAAAASAAALRSAPAAARALPSRASGPAMAAPAGTTTMASPVATRAAAADAAAAANANAAPSSRRLLVVGPGVLGAYAGLLWRESFPGAEVVAQTNTDERHPRLRDAGLTPRVRPEDFGSSSGGGGGGGGGASAGGAQEKFPFVLFAAPPSGSADYAAEVAAAASLWDGTGCMVFTSSMSVCAVEDGSAVDEACAVAKIGDDPKTDRLLSAERACMSAGGCVLRLVGLYHSTRGAHSFFFKAGDVPRYGGYTVNMLHYEDAADMAVAIMRGDGASAGGGAGAGAGAASGGGETGGGGGGAQKQQHRGEIFLGCDNHPLTFDAMVEACEASGLPAYQPAGRVKFTGSEPPAGKGGRGKRARNDATRAALGGWEPRYESFAKFFAPASEGGSEGRDWYGSAEGGKGQW